MLLTDTQCLDDVYNVIGQMSSLEAGDDVEAVTWAGARGPLRGYRGQRLGGEGGTRPAPAQHITHTVLRSDATTTTTTTQTTTTDLS